MRINLILPAVPYGPIGGFKVMYEYANHLTRRGHQVRVIHPFALGSGWNMLRTLKHHLLPPSTYVLSPNAYWKMVPPIANVLAPGGYWKDRERFIHWFHTDPDVRMYCVPNLSARFVPHSDAILATGWQTIPWVQKYERSRGEPYFLVQDYEPYMTADRKTRARIEAALRAGMHKIAISPAIVEMLEECGVKPDAYIANGLDFATFARDVPIDDPARVLIGFPTRDEPFKGTFDALRALEIVRQQAGGCCPVWSFGGKRPSYLPEWVTYYERPTDGELRALYNRTSIFIIPSHYEGWGLPGSEAMACGAALVSTDNGGVRAYAKHLETALLSPPREPQALAANALMLLRDPARRQALAQRGNEAIQRFTWSAATDAIERTLLRPSMIYEHESSSRARAHTTRGPTQVRP